MQKTVFFICCAVFVIIFTTHSFTLTTSPALAASIEIPVTQTVEPLVETQSTTSDISQPQTQTPEATLAPSYPTELIIPSINLDDTVIEVGLTSGGAMDVPSGTTQNVGWYKHGTIPGTIGSAVFDAHVFAAFSELHNVKAGDDLYVVDQNGTKLHFRVDQVETYPLAEVPADVLFNRADAAHLNLITCAGNLTPDHSTYDHRFVVYSTLVN